MTDFTSDIQIIPYSRERVFSFLSDLNNIDKVRGGLPENTICELVFDQDSCSFKTEQFGTIGFRIIEREPLKTIKLVSEKSPVPITCWIQLVETAPEDTRLKLTLRADIPLMFKAMVAKPIESGVRKVAETLASLPY